MKLYNYYRIKKFIFKTMSGREESIVLDKKLISSEKDLLTTNFIYIEFSNYESMVLGSKLGMEYDIVNLKFKKEDWISVKAKNNEMWLHITKDNLLRAVYTEYYSSCHQEQDIFETCSSSKPNKKFCKVTRKLNIDGNEIIVDSYVMLRSDNEINNFHDNKITYESFDSLINIPFMNTYYENKDTIVLEGCLSDVKLVIIRDIFKPVTCIETYDKNYEPTKEDLNEQSYGDVIEYLSNHTLPE